MIRAPVIIGIALLGFLPIWRSGIREKLNFYEFVGVHTVFSPYDVEYVPEELLTGANGIRRSY